MSWISLVGNVGGTLGMFVGFSFIGILEWIFGFSVKCLVKIKEMRKVSENLEIPTLSPCEFRKAKKLVKISLHLLLLIFALKFVSEAINDYLSGTKRIVVTKKPLTLDDLPTIAACIGLDVKQHLVFERDFFAEVKIFNKMQSKNYTAKLKENIQIQIGFGLSFHIQRLYRSREQNGIRYDKTEFNINYELEKLRDWQCYKLSSYRQGVSVVDFNNFEVQISFKQNDINKPLSIHNAHVWFTSEPNAYGLTTGSWFDGAIETKAKTTRSSHGLSIHMDPWVKMVPLVHSGHCVKISDVIEYQNQDVSSCSKDSYYQCLAKRFENFNFSRLENKTFNGKMCSASRPCAPFSLPFGNANNISICMNENDQGCHEYVITELQKDQTTYCRKPCQVVEYKTELDRWADQDFCGFNIGL